MNDTYAAQAAGEATLSGELLSDGALSRRATIEIVTVALLLCGLFWPNLERLWLKTNPYNGDAEWGHSIFVPLIGLYYLYVNREELLRATAKPAWLGLGIAILGILSLVFWYHPGQNDFLKDVSMAIIIFGVVLVLAGWRVMRIAWFPILFLICAFPWPPLVYSRIAGPLQRLAASIAVGTLRAAFVDAHNTGTKIIMSRGDGTPLPPLNVEEACAGLRSLMTFISVAAAMAFLSNRPLWQKILLTVSAIPIAIFCNVVRVAGQGLLHCYGSTGLSEGFAHTFVGLIMLIPAFFLLLLVGWVLDHVFVEEVEPGSSAARRPADVLVVQRGPKTATGVDVGGAADTSLPASPKPVTVPAAVATPSRPVRIPPKPAQPPQRAPQPAPAPAPDSLAAATQRLTPARTPPRPVRPGITPLRRPPTAPPSAPPDKPADPKEGL